MKKVTIAICTNPVLDFGTCNYERVVFSLKVESGDIPQFVKVLQENFDSVSLTINSLYEKSVVEKEQEQKAKA